MEVHRVVASLAILLLFLMLIPVCKVNAQDYIEYHIQINSDNSAAWMVTQVSDINAPIDSWENFQNRIFDLVDAAYSLTGREMAIDENSLQITTNVSASSKTTEYLFVWQNFSVNRNGELVFGEVFGVGGFFVQLYGEASVQISYPPTFAAKLVIPEPNVRDDSACTLRWYRTQDLVVSKTSIILAEKVDIETQSITRNAFIAIITAVVVALPLTSVYMVKRRKSKAKVANAASIPSAIESEEEKILKLLRAQGNTMRQSDITEQCRFSKAKTSQLLAALEKRGIITRYKKGRDKIVNFKETGKEEKL
jgi:uncharacterized membrane protein